ncbi:Ig-like V-type domain-containing protein FAM187A [Diadema antillarum]|uniref:Ig-like V-type domain-containing protein FAM187A n=1 Tax=Diadema antillarum TaxID=105358 RepID=UPI003A896605
MFTEWGSWSGCNHCGEPGERVRLGLCFARTRLHEFPRGVPCRSNVVPYSERSKYSISQRKDEKMVGACRQPCPPKPRPRGTQQLVRTYALSEGIPTLPQLVKRRVYYENIGDNAELVCPEAGVTHGVRWTNGSISLSQVELLKSNGRVWIDGLSRLRIDDVKRSDAGNFTCWFQDEKLAVVMIKVVEVPKVDKDMEGNAMYVGMVLTFLLVFYILFGVCRNRNLQTIQ